MTYLNTLLIDGTDVYDLPGVFAVDFIDGLDAPGTTRGDDDVIPGADGQLGHGLPVDRYLITVPLWVQGTSAADLNANVRAIGPLVTGARGLVTLTRKLDNGAGFDSHTAPGRFATGLGLSRVSDTVGSMDLQFYNLNGRWFDGSAWIY